MKPFKLDDYNKIEPGFKVPDNYFESFSARVLQEIEKPQPKVISLTRNRSTWIYASAAVLVLALAIPGLNMFFRPSEPDSETLENYIAYADISEDEIVNLLDTEDIEKIKINYNIEYQALEDALSSNPDLENYITE